MLEEVAADEGEEGGRVGDEGGWSGDGRPGGLGVQGPEGREVWSWEGEGEVRAVAERLFGRHCCVGWFLWVGLGGLEEGLSYSGVEVEV